MLELGKIPKRILEVKKQDGKILKLVIRKRTLEQIKDNEKTTKELQVKLNSGDIDSVDFLSGIFKLLIENYKYSDFSGLDVDGEVMLIIEELKKLQLEKPKDEKKNQSMKSTRK